MADVLEELPEEEQIDIIEELDDERAAEVLDLMEPDDAADLMSNLPKERSDAILELMDEEEADDLRRLMQYDEYTAGGLMTTEPIICAADATVAEAMALIRRKEGSSSLGFRYPASLRGRNRALPWRGSLPEDVALPTSRAPWLAAGHRH